MRFRMVVVVDEYDQWGSVKQLTDGSRSSHDTVRVKHCMEGCVIDYKLYSKAFHTNKFTECSSQ